MKQNIAKMIADFYGVTVHQMWKPFPRQSQQYLARRACMYVLSRYKGHQYDSIGVMFNVTKGAVYSEISKLREHKNAEKLQELERFMQSKVGAKMAQIIDDKTKALKNQRRVKNF